VYLKLQTSKFICMVVVLALISTELGLSNQLFTDES
jgi:hypothetical protein